MVYNVKQSLKRAIKDEQKAPKDYMRLKRLLKDKKEKKAIDNIIKDERHHAKQLKHIEKNYKVKKKDKDQKWINDYYKQLEKWNQNPFL